MTPFQKFKFSDKEIEARYVSAKGDLARAMKKGRDESEIMVFSYQALIKLAITLSAKHGLRVQSTAGHHVELLQKLAELLKIPKILKTGDEMRRARNKDLYDGTLLVSKTQADKYLAFVREVFAQADDYFHDKMPLF